MPDGQESQAEPAEGDRGRLADAEAVFPTMVEWRRHLHRNPEVGIDLPETHAFVADILSGLGLEIERQATGGITASVPGYQPDGVTSVLRGDMDALPLRERSGEAFSSQRDGAMHACGHDLHTAMLLGAARVLTEAPPRRDTVLVFQAGEESDHGALRVLQHRQVASLEQATAFAVHVNAVLPTGSIHVRPGTFMAFGDWFAIDYVGAGGHASSPEIAASPIEAGADTIRDMRSLVDDLDAAGHVVATVTEVTMGNTVNVIPTHGRLRGTIRALSAEQRGSLIRGIEDIVNTAADRVGVTGTVSWTEGYPAVVNDPHYVTALTERLAGHGLADRLQLMSKPSMVIEDFAYFLQRWPGAMVYLGANVEGHHSFNHSDDVVFDESVMALGAALHLIAADGLL